MFNRKSHLLDYHLSEQQDLFILITPIWGGRLASPMRTFVEKEKNRMHNIFLITICNGVEGQKEKVKTELSSLIQSEPIKVTELWINHLLPEDKQNKVKYTFNYRVSDNDFNQFNAEIDEFVSLVKKLCEY